MKALCLVAVAALVFALGVVLPGGVRAAQEPVPTPVDSPLAPGGVVDAQGSKIQDRSESSRQGAAAFRERVRAAAAALEVPVSAAETPGGLVYLRAGHPAGPTVVVIPPTDGDGLAARMVRGSDTSAPLGHVHSAMENAVALLGRALREEGVAGRLSTSSVLIVLGPGERLTESLGARSEAERTTGFEQNFPWRWDEARETHGAEAGPYPASRPDVMALSDLLLSDPRISCVLRAVPTPLGPHSPPASLAAFVKGRLKLEHRSPPTADALASEVAAALRELPELQWSGPVWRRMGANSWVVDLMLENAGSRPTGPSRGPAKELRLPQGIQLDVRVRGESYRWIACGAAPRAPVALQDRPIRKGEATLPSLGPGEALRVRLVLSADGKAAAEPPVLDIAASSGRAIGADLMGLSPPASQ